MVVPDRKVAPKSLPVRDLQSFKFVALVHEQVVDAPELEVHDVVLAVLDVESECLDFGFKVRLAFLYALEHTVGNVFALLGEDFEVLFHAVQFLLQDLFLYLRGLGDHAELCS